MWVGLLLVTLHSNSCYGIGVGVHGADGHMLREVTEEDEA